MEAYFTIQPLWVLLVEIAGIVDGLFMTGMLASMDNHPIAVIVS